jgi:hypothetical protein
MRDRPGLPEKEKQSVLRNKFSLLSILLSAAFLNSGPVMAGNAPSFTVHFSECTEFAGWGPISLAAAQPLVPAGYVIAGAASGQAAIVVRATSCESASMDQWPAQPTVLSQIGINVVAPDATGDINNYTLIYLTNNRMLAEYFQVAGLPAILMPT